MYGKSKLPGARAIAVAGCGHRILRTSWVFGAIGKYFLLTVIRAARERPDLKVVNDQVGTPTWRRDVASAMAVAVPKAPAESSKCGLSHSSETGATS